MTSHLRLSSFKNPKLKMTDLSRAAAFKDEEQEQFPQFFNYAGRF